MKKIDMVKKAAFVVITCGILAAAACATTENTEKAARTDTRDGAGNLNRALEEASAYFAAGLPAGSRIAITAVDAQTSVLSDYVIQELWVNLQKTGAFTMVDRQNSASVENEIFYQLSGAVPDDEAESIGNSLKADIIMYGSVLPFGNEYRMTLYATQPGRSTSLLKAINIPRLDPPFLPENSLDAALERSMTELGKNLTARTRVTIDKISYRGYETVSDLSKYLAENISHQAARQPMLRVVEDGTAAGAYLKGSFYPQNGGASVLLNMVSTYDGSYLGTSKLSISPAELDKLGLSMLPPDTSLSDLERVSRAIEPYKGRNNSFAFTVKPERSDSLYYNGERLSFTVYAEKDCYFKITHIDVKGKQTVLFPVSVKDNNFIKAGETRRMPPNRSFTIDLKEPFGVDYILAAAYSEQFAFSVDAEENEVTVSAESISKGLAVRGATRTETVSGTVSTDTHLVPAATARFSYSIMP